MLDRVLENKYFPASSCPDAQETDGMWPHGSFFSSFIYGNCTWHHQFGVFFPSGRYTNKWYYWKSHCFTNTLRLVVTWLVLKKSYVANSSESGKPLTRKGWVLKEVWLNSVQKEPGVDPSRNQGLARLSLHVLIHLSSFTWAVSAACKGFFGSIVPLLYNKGLIQIPSPEKPSLILRSAVSLPSGRGISVSALVTDWAHSCTGLCSPGSGNQRSEDGSHTSVHPQSTAHPPGPCLPSQSNYPSIEKTLRVILSRLWIN